MKKDIAVLTEDNCTGQLPLNFAKISSDVPVYEYAVLVTSLSDGMVTLPNIIVIGRTLKIYLAN